ncbi:MAG: hypothetical protein ABSG64_05180 [Solirubrobacteraceae bacterium]|jgi:hypothetical protein
MRRMMIALLATATLAGCGSSVLHPIKNLVDHHKSVALALCILHADRTIHDLKSHHDLAGLYHAYRVLQDCKHV